MPQNLNLKYSVAVIIAFHGIREEHPMNKKFAHTNHETARAERASACIKFGFMHDVSLFFHSNLSDYYIKIISKKCHKYLYGVGTAVLLNFNHNFFPFSHIINSRMSVYQTITVTITGAGGRIGYSLIPLICDGSTFGPNAKIRLKLLEVSSQMLRLEGIKMEIQDCNYPNLSEIQITSEISEAFTGSDVVVLLGGFPRLPGMERKDLIAKNVDIIKEHAEAIDKFSKKEVRVLVVANPANTNCLVAATVAKSIPSTNFTCLTRLDEERLKNLISEKINSNRTSCVKSADISNVCIFGNHSATQVPSTENGSVNFGYTKSMLGEVLDAEWIHGEMATKVQQRGAAVMNAQGASSAMSAAAAISKHLKDWLGPVVSADFFSMGVSSLNNPYGVPEDLFFSFPCRRLEEPGEYAIFPGIALTAATLSKLALTSEELIAEKNDAFACL